MNQKDIDQKGIHENIRKQFWVSVYIAYVGAANAINKDGAYAWADLALERFDERFKHPE